MKMYTFQAKQFEDAIQVGEPVEIEGEIVVVINILSVDFTLETVKFCGFKPSEYKEVK